MPLAFRKPSSSNLLQVPMLPEEMRSRFFAETPCPRVKRAIGSKSGFRWTISDERKWYPTRGRMISFPDWSNYSVTHLSGAVSNTSRYKWFPARRFRSASISGINWSECGWRAERYLRYERCVFEQELWTSVAASSHHCPVDRSSRNSRLEGVP